MAPLIEAMRMRFSFPRLTFACIALLTLAACSPEATRTRDGGPGADIGNTPRLASEPPRANPQAADTTLWPGKAMAPVDRLARGDTLPHT
jgi:hypothetical protein